MSRQTAESAIECRLTSGHQLRIPDTYQRKVGDFQVDQFEVMPNGQARQVKRSLLQTTDVSSTSAGLTFPAAGLLHAMRHVANQRQVPITTVVPNTFDLPAPVVSPLSRNPVIGAFMRTFDSGVIEYGGNLTKAQIVAEVCMAFPDHRVLAVSSHRRELRRVFDALPKYAPLVGVIDVSRGELPFDVDDVEIAEESDEIKACQLAIATPTASGMLWETTGTGVREFPIVIHLDAACAKDLMTSGFLMASHAKFRIFGLRHIETPFHGEAADLAQNVFGPARLTVPHSGFEQSEISHAWLPNHSKIRNLRHSKPVDVVRLIPHCTTRNNLVADVTQCLVDGARFEGDVSVHHWQQQHRIERPTVVIITRTFVQAARLGRRLPEWRVYRPDTSPEQLIGLKAADRKLIVERSVGHPCSSRIILPHDYLMPFLREADPEIIVQASGGLLAPTFPRTWFRHPAGTQRHRLVIDFFDDALPITRKISQRRFADYAPPDFLPVDLEASRDDLSVGLPLLAFIKRTFKPARSRRSSR